MPTANEIRRQWMAEMGLDPNEIDEAIAMYPAWDPYAEQRELDAIRDIKSRINHVHNLNNRTASEKMD